MLLVHFLVRHPISKLWTVLAKSSKNPLTAFTERPFGKIAPTNKGNKMDSAGT